MNKRFELIIEDIRVDLTQYFDGSFEKKGFGGRSWVAVKREPGIGSLMERTGGLRQSIQSQTSGNTITFTSSRPYAQIHNEGGDIRRTSKRGKPYTIHIPQRQFIGENAETNKKIEEHVDKGVQDLINELLNQKFKL